MFAKAIVALAGLPLLIAAAPADGLPRSVAFGISGAGEGAVVVDRVVPGMTADRMGVRAGDRVTAVNGKAVAGMADLAGVARTLSPGADLRVALERGGKPLVMRGRALPRPPEAFANGTVRLGAVPFGGGLLRDFMATPLSPAKGAPVAMILQGYTCNAVETGSAEQPLHRLIDQLLARGIAVYRVEKPGAGDSRGGAACADIDFATEMAGFAAGYDALVSRHGVDPSGIVLVGLSMGGVEAPLLANRLAVPPRGIAVWGTVVRPWHDYMLDVLRIQPFLSTGQDPAKGEALAAEARAPLGRIFLAGDDAALVARQDVATAALLRDALGWDGGSRLFGRHYRFWHGVSGQRLAAAWAGIRSPVLSLYGESDTAAIDQRDQELIAHIVNAKRPGTARFAMIANTGHGMTLDGSPAELRAGKGVEDGDYNPAVGTAISDWIVALAG